MRRSRLVFKPVSLVLGTAGGLLAGAAFKKTWQILGHEDDAPDATDEDRRWREILLAAAIQGAIFAVVKAAVGRGGATAVRRVTGVWPA
ncbi:DUF4235 domain-containing protein [Streptomyces sp. NPDC012693]|jgi:hypothetical protein|uniref:DUF4235 domain-containing protein n=1 Tax=unclassified Streptomyces TaxID=2593676 RepID=UPI00202F2639|nr:DUF4235 domain-containing protein [Streptomyces sp. MSC1_001]